MSGFNEKCYELLKKVPEGRVTTYKELALALNTKAYQAVGQVMRNNPYAPEVPCHRVISSNGSIGGFAGQTKGKKIKEKISLLKKEGIKFKGNKIKNFDKVLHRF